MDTSSARHLEIESTATVHGLPVHPEIIELRNALRDRHSVDHFARAWYGSLFSLLLCGVWIKLWHDSRGPTLFLWPGALLCLSVIAFAAKELRLGLRLMSQERGLLARLRALEAEAPPRPELF
jgi:hypothetical protein